VVSCLFSGIGVEQSLNAIRIAERLSVNTGYTITIESFFVQLNFNILLKQDALFVPGENWGNVESKLLLAMLPPLHR
jgi:hypothetical protein